MPDVPDQPAERSRSPWAWVILFVLVVVFSALLAVAGLPSPVLFGSLAAGLLFALVAARVPEIPGLSFSIAQAVLGAAIGASLKPSAITVLAQDWFPVLASCLATLLLSLAAGYVLRLWGGVSAPTGVFAMIAGGASGIVAISRDLGADERVVAVVQYLRVLIILLGMPLVTQVVFGAPGVSTDAEVYDADSMPPTFGPFILEVDPATWSGLALAALALLIGLPLSRLIRFPAGALLFPMIVAAALAGTGTITAGVPPLLEAAGFALIGLQVGLRFTRKSLKAVAALLPLATVTIIGLIAVSAGLGVILARATDRTLLDGYLATTPGGLYAVLATAVGTDSDVAFVLMVQVARLFVILLCAPLLARLLAGRKT